MNESKPWYRHPLVWLVIGIPLAGVIMASITATMAYRYADVDVGTSVHPPLTKTSWHDAKQQ